MDMWTYNNNAVHKKVEKDYRFLFHICFIFIPTIQLSFSAWFSWKDRIRERERKDYIMCSGALLCLYSRPLYFLFSPVNYFFERSRLQGHSRQQSVEQQFITLQKGKWKRYGIHVNLYLDWTGVVCSLEWNSRQFTFPHACVPMNITSFI